MQPAARITAIIELVSNFMDMLEEGRKTPIDGYLAKYFRENRYIGSHDRGEISGLFYFIVRNYAALNWWAVQHTFTPHPRILTLFAAIFTGKYSPSTLQEICNGERFAPATLKKSEIEALQIASNSELSNDKMPDDVRLNVPKWWFQTIKSHYSDMTEDLLKAMSLEAPTDIRANALKTNKHELKKILKTQGVLAEEIEHVEHGLRINRRAGLFGLEAFQNGLFEIQDAGSQIVSNLVAAKAGDKVIDFCAGAGGKTLAIAANMAGKGRILALDVSAHRMQDMSKRLKRANVQNTQVKQIVNEKDEWLKRHKYSADYVLIDAPCTGCGTWRRNPDMKWRTEEKDLQELLTIQQNILLSASKLLKNSGKLIYATCSILPEENQQQIDNFLLVNQDFKISQIDFANNKYDYLQLLPNLHQTDGFFACVLEKQ
jgi:16S rRNA (cytosine967-C5)-methyltransferase